MGAGEEVQQRERAAEGESGGENEKDRERAVEGVRGRESGRESMGEIAQERE